MRKRKKTEHFKDEANRLDQKSFWKLMLDIDKTGLAVPVLKSRQASKESLSKDLVLGTLVRLKQLKKWNLVSEVFVLLSSVLCSHLVSLLQAI